jgi:ankyrin repeat domain-containing protein 50
MLATNKHIFVILDGIDEIPFGRPRTAVLTFVQRLVSKHLSHLHLLVTSRPEHDILKHLNEFNRWMSMAAPKEAIAEDIKRYVKTDIERDPELKILPYATKDLIIERLCGEENCM